MPEPVASSMRSLDRSLDVLDCLQRSEAPLRLSDVAARTGLTLPTASRILAALEARGYVASDAKRFRLGASVLGAAHAFLLTDPLVGASRQHLQHLAQATGLTCSLYERVGFERVLVARVDGQWPLRYELPIGRRLPLYLGAGKAIAVDLDDDELQALEAHARTHPDPSGAGLDLAALRADLAGLRERGFHISVGERAPGIIALSVPVRAADASPLGALSIAGPAEQNSREQVQGWAVETVRAAAAIAQGRARVV
ncbi:IclR family transcriptional regulator [Quadrisphaera granulorum]|uniref:IclR family transcriptional regulator n=1 Tax=Quadrisphaera granulorum TaxID=317664 RepID=UPI0014764A1D|nr:IclR family transcriptional regulator [Quadrisphaera granulorum]